MTSDHDRPDWTAWRERQQERGADHQPPDLALPPITVNVSKRLLLSPPIGDRMLTTNTFRRCLVIVGSAQKLLVLDPGLRDQPNVEVARMKVPRLARWCGYTTTSRASAKGKLTNLLTILQDEERMGVLPPPVDSFSFASTGRVTYSIVVPGWLFITGQPYRKITLSEMPVGSEAKCRAWLRQKAAAL